MVREQADRITTHHPSSLRGARQRWHIASLPPTPSSVIQYSVPSGTPRGSHSGPRRPARWSQVSSKVTRGCSAALPGVLPIFAIGTSLSIRSARWLASAFWCRSRGSQRPRRVPQGSGGWCSVRRRLDGIPTPCLLRLHQSPGTGEGRFILRGVLEGLLAVTEEFLKHRYPVLGTRHRYGRRAACKSVADRPGRTAGEYGNLHREFHRFRTRR